MPEPRKPEAASLVIVGGGPAGLMAAETAAQAGLRVDLYDAMPSVGRKFLLAGKGGLNLTHAEPFDDFVTRYAERQNRMAPLLAGFGADSVRAWAHSLGIDTFVGSSGRVFPSDLKAAPLVRAWLARLRASGVRFHMRHRWLGWTDQGELRFAAPQGEIAIGAGATLLALGGASWPKLGSDATWVSVLTAAGIAVTPLRPSNCGFEVGWTPYFRERCAGMPVKSVGLTLQRADGTTAQRIGEFVVTAHGVEGSAIYAWSSYLRDAIAAHGSALIHLDLAPGRDLPRLTAELARSPGSRSLSQHLRREAGVDGIRAALLRELAPADAFADRSRLARLIKHLPLRLNAPRPIEEAISSAGGVSFQSLDERLMLRDLPGVFCAGEMLDWEAPTGGYLLTACFASGRAAGAGAAQWAKQLVEHPPAQHA